MKALSISNLLSPISSYRDIIWVALYMALRQWSCSSVDKGMALVTSQNVGNPGRPVPLDIEAMIRALCQQQSNHIQVPSTSFQGPCRQIL